MLVRIWNYLKTLFGMAAERAMDPAVEIEQAINEAKARNQQLRNQAAKVIAHRTQIEAKIEDIGQGCRRSAGNRQAGFAQGRGGQDRR